MAAEAAASAIELCKFHLYTRYQLLEARERRRESGGWLRVFSPPLKVSGKERSDAMGSEAGLIKTQLSQLFSAIL